jgi:hypothetical protein
MNWLTRWFNERPAVGERPRTTVPVVEELEPRRVLSSPQTFAVASGILNSPENYGDFIMQEYSNLLGRAPDYSGFNYWLGQMESGVAPEAVESGIASSVEYIQNHGNDQVAWLDGLYQNLLGRAPDIDGVNHWLGNLAASESAAGVAFEISTSAEREINIINQDYALFLGRSPDADGINHWLGQFQQGWSRADVASDIAASDEFFANSGNDPAQFIANLYQDVLGRSPGQDEVDFWLNVY